MTAWKLLPLLVSLIVSAQVWAADVPARFANVTLIQEPCAGYDATELVRLLQLELSARGVGALSIRERLDGVHVADAGLAVVHLRCDKERESVIAEVADLTTGNQIRRDLPLADLEPAARARALSLAVTALVEASWLELALAEPSSKPDGLPPEVVSALRQRLQNHLEPTPPMAAPAPPPPDAALAWLGTARNHPTRSTSLLGVELMYSPLLSRTRLCASAEALFGVQHVSDPSGKLASVHVYSFGASLALAWASHTQPELAIGPSVRLGYAAASASDLRAGAAAHSGGGFFATLGARALMRAELSDAWDLLLGLDFGYTLSGVVFEVGANDRAGLTDLTFGLHAGLGVRP